MSQMIATMRTWGEMVKFAHSVFALPFALFAMFLAAAPARPSLSQFALIVICMVTARSAAMTFNRIVDARLDALNPRTADRSIPAGLITPRAAWAFFVASAAGFVVTCVGFLLLHDNLWPLALSVPVLAYLCFYSLTKRFTRWSHIILGSGIALSPVAAWIAISPDTLGLAAWLLMAAVASWIGGFDLIYACQDVACDRQLGLHSVPASMGVGAALWLARVLHVITVAALAAVGITAQLGGLYFAGVVGVALLLIIENALVSPQNLSRVNLAFFTVNGIVGVVFGAVGIVDVVL